MIRWTSSGLKISGSFWGCLGPGTVNVATGRFRVVWDQEPERGHGDVARTPGELIFPEHVHEIALDLLRGELVGGLPIELGQPGDGRQVALARPRREAAHEHV